MFSGIVEEKSVPVSLVDRDHLIELKIKKPSKFNDINTGDSIAVDGVCLTVEKVDENSLQFAIAAETLHITSWKLDNLMDKELNLERSLKIGERVHGHFVTGHVDGVGVVSALEKLGESTIMTIDFPHHLSPYLWSKGSLALNGVSLTINKIKNNSLDVCLIPETLRQTNLVDLKLGQQINIEVDNFARGLMRAIELGFPTERGSL